MTRLECSALRCLAIMSILLHNFAHCLPDTAKENEFYLEIENYEFFWKSVFGTDFIIQILSHFGHLGVPVFVFLTGYGLAQKYDSMEHLDWKCFLFRHWKKLFVPLVVGVLAYYSVTFVMEGHLIRPVSMIVKQCTMLLNYLSPMDIHPMPYWYLGMTMQLYVVYLLFVYKRTIVPLLLLAIASLIFMACQADHFSYVVMSKFNCIGWLAPLCMGIAFSRYQSKVHVERGIRLMGASVLSLVLVLLCGFNFYTWLLIPLFIVIMSVGVVKYVPVSFQKKMDFIGKNSLYLLIVHPITRVLIVPLIPSLGGYISMIIYICITVVVVYGFLNKNLVFRSLIRTFAGDYDNG